MYLRCFRSKITYFYFIVQHKNHYKCIRRRSSVPIIIHGNRPSNNCDLLNVITRYTVSFGNNTQTNPKERRYNIVYVDKNYQSYAIFWGACLIVTNNNNNNIKWWYKFSFSNTIDLWGISPCHVVPFKLRSLFFISVQVFTVLVNSEPRNIY